MPPKVQMTREKIIEGGLELIRREGAEALNVRRIATELNCSTQPIMYQFSSVDELKAAIYSAADEFHTGYIMSADLTDGDPMLSIGLNYIRFASEEKHLFRFLFQSGQFTNSGFGELMDSEGLSPVFEILQTEAGITAEQSKEAFAALFLTVHGIASLLANNSMEYDEKYYERVLNDVFMGVIGMMKGGSI